MAETDDALLDQINKYYVVKSKYEDNFNKKKKDILNSTKLSKKDKTEKISKLKHVCVKCKRNKGMTFTSMKKEEGTIRELSYKCNNDPPCTLAGTVDVLISVHLDDLILSERAEYNQKVDFLLKNKYDLLFDYVRENTDALKQIIEHFTISKENLSDALKINDSRKRDPKVREDLERLETRMRSLIDTTIDHDANFDEKFKAIITEINGLESEIQNIKHPTLSVEPLTNKFTFNHTYTLNDLILNY